MTTEPSTPSRDEQPRPSLPTFDPNAPVGATAQPLPDDTQTLPSAATSEIPVIAGPSTPYAYAAGPPSATADSAAGPGPAVPTAGTGGSVPSAAPTDATAEPRWNGKKTAAVAGLAIVLTSAGAIGAAAAMPSGSTGTADFGGRGVRGGFHLPGQLQQGNGTTGNGTVPQNGGQLPNLQGGTDPNQLQGLDPSQLLQQLDPSQLQGLDPRQLLRQLDPGQLGQPADPGDDGTTGSTGSTRTT